MLFDILEALDKGYEIKFGKDGQDVRLTVIKAATRSHWTGKIGKSFHIESGEVGAGIENGINGIKQAESKIKVQGEVGESNF